jgi:trehalose 6-phosphate phosphatase
VSGDSLSPPSPQLLKGKSLFLDLDGTLLDLIDQPEHVRADPALIDLLEALVDRLDGRLALVSGRSIAQIDTIIGPFAERVAVSGSHGHEHRWQGVEAHPIRPAIFDTVAERFRAFAERHDGVLVEEKSFGVGLHYRLAPHVEPAAQGLALELAAGNELFVQHGKMMVELRLAGGDKGTAVRRLMRRPPMSAGVPLFVGDDVTDEAGFEAACDLGGGAVLVGAPRPTCAVHALPDPAAVRAWLAAFAGEGGE